MSPVMDESLNPLPEWTFKSRLKLSLVLESLSRFNVGLLEVSTFVVNRDIVKLPGL